MTKGASARFLPVASDPVPASLPIARFPPYALRGIREPQELFTIVNA
jgi:hypothetical protein